MRGLLNDLPLLGVFELIHTTRQSGVLEVQAELPFTLVFQSGEIVSGGILDWLGPEALYSCPMLPVSGAFEFTPRPVTGLALGPFNKVTSDWARIHDEWERLCQVIGSPSRYFHGALPLFENRRGRSIRSAAREAEAPLFQVAQVVAQAVQEGRLQPLPRYEWFRLTLRPAGQRHSLNPVARRLSGERNMGEVVGNGVTLHEVRQYLMTELRMGLRFPGSGWVLRDLVWEAQYAP